MRELILKIWREITTQSIDLRYFSTKKSAAILFERLDFNDQVEQ